MHIIQVSLLNIAETEIFNISKLFKAFPKAMPALPKDPATGEGTM